MKRPLLLFSAGTSYYEVWIRDFNTFIKGSLKIRSKERVKSMLLMFFKIQGNDESSLVQAVKGYIDLTGDVSILSERINAKTILQRMKDSFFYILKDRWSKKYGLVKGATTVDWGEVQPEKGWGGAINAHIKWAIKMQKDRVALAASIKANLRKHLWMADAQKYRPPIYLNGSPFSKTFVEGKILYSSGSVCAVLAGFNTEKKVENINNQILAAASKEKYATIGFTVYPPYPGIEFPDMLPYSYQNGGDWTWYGGRMINGLVAHDLKRLMQNLCLW